MQKKEEERWPVEVIKSKKRRKTVGATLKDGVLVVRAPATMSDEDLEPIIADFQVRMARKVRPIAQTDEMLQQRAQELNRAFFNDRLRWQSIRYVKNQNKRFGSCTPARGTIRLTDRLATMPTWVRDYVIVHELAHLEQANHGPQFWALVNPYPLTERARGYLMAIGLEEEGVQ